MNRSSGIGLMVFGIVLVVVGAMMKFAVFFSWLTSLWALSSRTHTTTSCT